MKFRFEADLDFQIQAVNAVCDLFRGQEVHKSEFAVTQISLTSQTDDFDPSTDPNTANILTLTQDEIYENLKDVQLRNGLPQSPELDSTDFTVEMETGTGKTYVYLRTIFELNNRYGFRKFVIVVPSVAIKEGVYKSLQVTQEHFRSLYSGSIYEYFIYDSAKLGDVCNFAISTQIHIMVVTVGAINKKDVNNLYKDFENIGDSKPIELIRATNPILIVDEPQSVDGGLKGQGKRALEEMNALCTLRYSATHADRYHMVYRLDAFAAYERKIVKRIEVASATIEGAHNQPYVRLISTTNKRGVISAKIEIDTESSGRVRRKVQIVQDGDDLESKAGRAVYRHFRVGEIRVGKGDSFVEIQMPSGECYLEKGQAINDVDSSIVIRHMIRRTIDEHLRKEKLLRPQGIKVLSLFFIDSVSRYRRYDASGNAVKGDYATMFEEEYRRMSTHPDHKSTFQCDSEPDIDAFHNGYFSIDRKGHWHDTEENNQKNRENAERAYNLIMRDKEKLLSLNEPLKFIFSHSALREGWDNPNVFQICVLRDIQSEGERRQTIGRGLRLCVNQDGQRLSGFELNTLTVIAKENYEEFAENLQREIEKDTGVRFGFIEPHHFAYITIEEDKIETVFGYKKSYEFYNYLQDRGYIDRNGEVQDVLRDALKTDSFEVPQTFAAFGEALLTVLRRFVGRFEVRNADERQDVRLRDSVWHSNDFKDLWDRIKHKTTYRVAFKKEELLESCVEAVRTLDPMPKPRMEWHKAAIQIGQIGVEALETAELPSSVVEETNNEWPDLLTELQERTQLTRKSIHRILIDSDRLDCFKQNPQQFIKYVAQEINRCKREALVDGIRYRRIGDESYYAQELFEPDDLTEYLHRMVAAKKSVFENVVLDSAREANFVTQFENNTGVKVYAKLPNWFKVPTPLGQYNPDWAVLILTDTGERLYLVVETKGSTNLDDLRYSEVRKIECAKKHFKALAIGTSSVRYEVVESVTQLFERVIGN